MAKKNTNKYSRELPENERQVKEELAQGIVRRLSDSLFKFVFCKRERLPIFLDMVNAFIYPDGEKAFKEAHFVDREKSPEKNRGKAGRFDARAKLDDNIDVNVESQITAASDYLDRVINYVSWIHGDQLNRREEYGTTTPTISISILDCAQLKDREKYRNSASLRYNEDGTLCSDKITLIFLELPKFLKQVEAPSTKRWLAYLAGTGGQEMGQIAEQEPMIQEALKAEEFFLADEETRAAYMMDLKHMLEETSRETRLKLAEARLETEQKAKEVEQKARLEAEQKAKEAGQKAKEAGQKAKEVEQKAKEDKEEMARKMLKAGMAPDTVAEISGIPAKELLSLVMPQTSKDETIKKAASAPYVSFTDKQAAEDAAVAAAKQQMGSGSFIINAKEVTPGTYNGKIVAAVKSDSDIVFVQQLAGDKSLSVMYHMDLKDIQPGLNITVGANPTITKARDGNITIKTLERGQERDKGMER
ncbi:MAG: Rpn family recombination-promoting nuclease/putative transposase [Synergistaceae bacterium]|nr:Rpn family recombination-promoting nuclease/putative transposase [Synergistaceae bacterium]